MTGRPAGSANQHSSDYRRAIADSQCVFHAGDDDRPHEPLSREPDPSSSAAALEAAERVEQVLRVMTFRQRLAHRLHDLGGLTPTVVASQLGVSRARVQQLLDPPELLLQRGISERVMQRLTQG